MAAKPNVRFVWQYDGAALPAALPANVYAAAWLPLQDLLGHAKCKAHISHGGSNSVIESMWHGVPVIGWPLTARNYDNLLRVTARHAGLMLPQKQPTKHQFMSAINRIYVRHYKEEALIFQDMLIDVPYTELDHAAFWVEFVIRHQEVPHARSGADELSILSYFLVDVILFLLSALVIVIMLGFYATRALLRGVVRGGRALLDIRGQRKLRVATADKRKKTN